jgi:hypothetical protein
VAGSSGGGAVCSQLAACCGTLPGGEAQSSCQSIASGGNEDTCGQVFTSYQNAGLCGGG